MSAIEDDWPNGLTVGDGGSWLDRLRGTSLENLHSQIEVQIRWIEIKERDLNIMKRIYAERTGREGEQV